MAFYIIPAIMVNLQTKEEKYIYMICTGETKEEALKDFVSIVCKKESSNVIYYQDLFDSISNPNGRIAYKFNLHLAYQKRKQCLAI